MVRGASTRESVPTRGGEGGQGSGGGEPLWSRGRGRTEMEEGEGVVTSWATLSAYRESKLCLAYERTNTSICASFLPRMATTSFQGRSRREPFPPLPSPRPAAWIFRALQIPPQASTGRSSSSNDRTEIRPGRSTSQCAAQPLPHGFRGWFSAIHDDGRGVGVCRFDLLYTVDYATMSNSIRSGDFPCDFPSV